MKKVIEYRYIDLKNLEDQSKTYCNRCKYCKDVQEKIKSTSYQRFLWLKKKIGVNNWEILRKDKLGRADDNLQFDRNREVFQDSVPLEIDVEIKRILENIDHGKYASGIGL